MKDDAQFLTRPAVERMKNAGLNVEEKAYGFRLEYPENDVVIVGECGGEHNGGISISLKCKPSKNIWFVRYSMAEMADFLIAAHKLVIAQGGDWISTLKRIDLKYDHKALERRLVEKYPGLNGR